MNRRLRLVAALLALFALSAYMGEGLWASLCPPGMQTHGSLAGDAAAAPVEGGLHHGSHASSSDEPEPSQPDTPRCPLGMTGVGSSCVAASLPAVATMIAPPIAGPTLAVFSLDGTHGRLLAVAHFRPPRA